MPPKILLQKAECSEISAAIHEFSLKVTFKKAALFCGVIDACVCVKN